MSLRKKAFALTLLTALPIAGYSCMGTWNDGGMNENWSDAANWGGGCVPGSSSTTAQDIAIIPTTSAGNITIHLDIPVGLNELQFLSTSSSYTITPNSTMDFMQFNGMTPLLQAVNGTHAIAAHIEVAAGSILDIQVGTSGTGMLTLAQGLATTSDVNFSGPDHLTLQWNGLNAIDDFNEFSSNANLNVTGGVLLNSNIIPLTNGNIGTSIMANNLFVSAGEFLIDNTADITNSVAGSTVNLNGGMTVTSGSLVKLTNSGAVSGTMGAGVGSWLEMLSDLTINDSMLMNENTGAITNSVDSTGCYILTRGNLSLSNVTLYNLNSGSIDNNCFGAVITADALTMTSGTIFNTNTGTIVGNGIGSTINVASILQLNGGLLVNNDHVQATTVNVGSGGTMTGTGIFQDYGGGATTTITNGGTVIPGGPSVASSPGSTLIRGSYTQTPVATLVINLDKLTSFSQLNVTGPAQLAGNLEVALSPGASVSETDAYKILLAGGGVSGKFGNIINFNLGNLMPQVQYFPTYVLLSFMGPATALSQTTYLNYLEALFSTVNHLNVRLDRQIGQLRKRFTPRQEPETTMAAIQIQDFSDLLADNSVGVAPNGPRSHVQEKQEQLRETITGGYNEPWRVYFGPTADVGRVLTRKDATGFHYDGVGGLAGFDYAFSQVGLGALFDYDHLDVRGDHHWGKVDVDEIHLSLYGTYAPKSLPELALNGIVGGGYDWYRIRRNIPILSDEAQSVPRGAEFDALLGLEYALEKRQIQGMPARLQIVPLVNVQYMHLHVNKYNEHGAGIFDVTFKKQSAESLRSTLGLRLNYTCQTKNMVFAPEINLAWQREYMDHDRSMGISTTGLSSSLIIPQSGRNVALGGMDLLFTFFDTYGLEASYDFEWNSLYLDHSFYLGCSFRY